MTVSSRSRRKAALLVVVSVAVGLVTLSAVAARGSRVGTWRTIDLGVLPAHGYTYSEALAVSDTGVIVGWSWGGLDVVHTAVEWKRTGNGWHAMRLGPLQDDSQANGVNANGVVVGSIGTNVHAVVWRGGQRVNLSGLGGRSDAVAVNDQGQIAGWCESSSGELHHAVVWDSHGHGNLTDLGTPLGYQSSAANDLNERGQVVGSVWNGDYVDSRNIRAFVWSGGRVRLLPGLPGSHDTEAYAINDTGVVIGASDAGRGVSQPVLWRNGQIHVLPLPAGARGGYASDINDSGAVVGGYGTTAGHPVLWRDGKAVELPAKKASNTAAYAVNASGVIVGRNNLRAAAWTTP